MGHATRRLMGVMAAGMVALAAGLPARAAGPPSAAPALAPYVKAEGVAGSVTIVGSDLLARPLAELAEWFQRQYPEAKVQVRPADSTAAAAALIQGAAQLAVLSRLMEEGEVAKFEAAHGYRPTPYAVAVDALAVCVHKDNPLEGLTLDQADAIFSKTPRYSYRNITSWGQLGLGGEWAETPITLYGLASTTGTHEFFKDKALNKEDFKAGIREFADSAAVVHAVVHDRTGMGYGSLAAATSEVRVVPLAYDEGSPFVEPSVENIKGRKYPLRRYIYVYVNQAPRKLLPGHKPLPPAVREFLRLLHSQEGQAALVKDGYVGVEDWIIQHGLAKIK